MRRKGLIDCLLLAASLPSPAAIARPVSADVFIDSFAKQDIETVSIYQVSTEHPGGVGMAQALEVAPPRRGVAEDVQIANRRDSRGMPAQLTTDRRSPSSITALSSRRESAPGPAVALAGSDRCDPARTAAQMPAQTAGECDQILENRADTFARPVRVPEEEEGTTVPRKPPGGGLRAGTADGVAQMRNPGENSDDRTSQELASIILLAPAQPAEVPGQGKEQEAVPNGIPGPVIIFNGN